MIPVKATPTCATTDTYARRASLRYFLEEFLQTIAGSSYLDTQTQYGAGNVAPLFLGDWFDQTEPPATPSSDDIVGEVINAYGHFAPIFGSTTQVIIIIALPPGHAISGFNAGAPCAYHAFTNAIFGQNGPPFAYYIVLPCEPENPSCGGFTPNPQSSSDSFGHGVLDGVWRRSYPMAAGIYASPAFANSIRSASVAIAVS